MTKPYPVSAAPGPLEDYAHSFDDLFGARPQRHAFRRYMQGLLLPPAERNKTLSALARAGCRSAAKGGAEPPAMVSLGVEVGSPGGQRAPSGAHGRRFA
jgi:hypothetical protein